MFVNNTNRMLTHGRCSWIENCVSKVYKWLWFIPRCPIYYVRPQSIGFESPIFSSKMNAFNVIQSQFCLLGICSPPKNQPHTLAFHRKYLAILFLITLQIVLEIVFLAIEAANYDEISASVFIILTSFVSIVFYLSLKCQSNSVFKLISHFDAFVHDRKTLHSILHFPNIDFNNATHFRLKNAGLGRSLWEKRP